MAISALFILTICSYLFILGHCHHTHSTNQMYRTAYHFQPPKYWINDPNGPMRYEGLYHLFYQYNPEGAQWAWGKIVWGHSVSKDLIDWTILEKAIYPSKPYDIEGSWSGSTTILSGGKPAILYTGADQHKHQLQNLALPKNASDPYLREWVKMPQNPIMAPTRANGINSSSFRDPSTAWLGKDGLYRVLVGNKRDTTGRALLYRSEDFVHWVETKHPLYSANGTGMWECPDFFPILSKSVFGVGTSVDGPFVRHVLKVSLDDIKQDYYLIGTYDAQKDKFVPDSIEGFHNIESVLRYDYGKYYASKTFFDDSKKRRILLGWINESSSDVVYVKRGWAGIHAIPRAIWLHKSGKQLVQWPVVEIERLRSKPISWSNKVLSAAQHIQVTGVTAAQADVEVSFEANDFGKAEVLDYWVKPQLLCSRKDAAVKGGLGPFGLLAFASKDLNEYTAVFFRVFIYQRKPLVLFCSDQSRSSMNYVDHDLASYGTLLNVDPSYEKISLRSLIDHSVVESFGGKGSRVITARVYPTMAINDEARLYVFNYGATDVKISTLNAWSMNKAQIS